MSMWIFVLLCYYYSLLPSILSFFADRNIITIRPSTVSETITTTGQTTQAKRPSATSSAGNINIYMQVHYSTEVNCK